MIFVIDSLDAGRAALKRAIEETRTSITAFTAAAKVSAGTTNRFISNYRRVDQKSPADLHLSSFIRLVEHAGYEVVIRKKDPSNRRSRLRKAIREANGGSET